MNRNVLSLISNGDEGETQKEILQLLNYKEVNQIKYQKNNRTNQK